MRDGATPSSVYSVASSKDTQEQEVKQQFKGAERFNEVNMPRYATAWCFSIPLTAPNNTVSFLVSILARCSDTSDIHHHSV